MIDCWLTEGEVAFHARYVAKPDGLSLATKDGKAWKEANADREIVTESDLAILADAVAAVKSLPCWGQLLRAQAQCTIRRAATNLGFGLQSRPDWVLIEGNEVTTFDLKKTRSLANFGKQAIDLSYHMQASLAGWCLAGDGLTHTSARLVAVEWERGARAREYVIPTEALADGFRKLKEAGNEISRRLRENDWTDRQEQAEPLPIPDWMVRRMETA